MSVPLPLAVPAEEIAVRIEGAAVQVIAASRWVVTRGIPPAPMEPKEAALWADDFATIAKLEFRTSGVELGVSRHDLAVQICRAVLAQQS